MPFITVNIPESLSHSLLGLVERLVVAVERIAGPELEYRPPTPATLRDYSFVTPEAADAAIKAEQEFGARNLVVPGSPAYLAAIAQFELDVAQAYGEDAVGKLPWRLPTGNLPTGDTK